MSFITPPPPIAAQRVAVTNVWDGEAPDLLGR
jgi:hypothetical protein